MYMRASTSLRLHGECGGGGLAIMLVELVKQINWSRSFRG